MSAGNLHGFNLGDNVIVRCTGSGVVFGKYAGGQGPTIKIMLAIQLWEWQASKGVTLIDVAAFGVEASGSKFSSQGGDMVVFDACALIRPTDHASASIIAVALAAGK